MDKDKKYKEMIDSFHIAGDNLNIIYSKMREMKLCGDLSNDEKDWLEMHVKALHKSIIQINDLFISKIR